jgi:hypothetical protein
VGEGVFVLAADLGVGEPGVDQRPGGALAEDGHDGLGPGAGFGELGAHGVSGAVGADRGHTVLVEESGRGAGVSEGHVEQERGREQFAVTDEDVV